MTVQAASIFYGIAIGIAVVAILFSFSQKSGRIQRYLLMCSFLVFLLAVGRWLYVNSDGITSMLASRKVINFTGCWLWLFIFLFIAEYTRYKVHRTTIILSVILGAFNSLMTFILNIKGVVYQDYFFELRDNLPYLHRTGYAVGGYIYLVSEYLFLFSAMFLIIVFLAKHAKENGRVTVLIIFSIAIPSGAYLVEFILKPDISIVSLASSVGVILLALLVQNGSVYDMEEIVRDIAADAQHSPVILIQDSKYFIAANEHGFKAFPELSNAVPWTDMWDIFPGLMELYSGERAELERNGTIFEPNIWKVKDKKRKIEALWLRDVTESRKHQEFMANYRSDLEKEVAIKTESLMMTEGRLSETLTQTVTTLMSMVDAKDRYTSGHSFRVAVYSKMIAERLGKTKAQQDLIYVTALLHDVGKIHVPESIINKKGRITNEEYEVVKLHPITGYTVLSSMTPIPEILSGARSHHERYDGAGYPDGLSGKDIPEIARIISVADSYDAMSSRRSYRKTLPQNVVRDEIVAGKGTQFDPEIADIMLSIIDSDPAYTLCQSNDDFVGKVLILGDTEASDRMSAMLSDSKTFLVKDVLNLSELYGRTEDELSRIVLIIDTDSGNNVDISAVRNKYQSVSIIAVTRDHSFETFRRFISDGADNCLMRPFTKINLQEASAVILHRKASMLSWSKGNVSAWSLGWM